MKVGSRRQKAEGWANSLNSPPAGFTLIELLTSLIIIVILAALVVGTAKYASLKASTSRAQGEIAAMEMALEHYKSDNGVYPPSTTTRATVLGYPTTIEIYNSTNLYSALANGKYFAFKPNQLGGTGTGTYVVDPFGNPYNYFCPPAPTTLTWSNQATFDLWSYGPDGKNDTADDIVNWRH